MISALSGVYAGRVLRSASFMPLLARLIASMAFRQIAMDAMVVHTGGKKLKYVGCCWLPGADALATDAALAPYGASRSMGTFLWQASSRSLVEADA